MGVLKTMKKKCFKSFLLFLVASLLFPAAVMAAGEGHALHELKPFIVQQPRKQAAAPEFRLKDLEGRERSLSEFKGKTVLIHFWASWCEPCRQEFPALSRLSREYRDRGLVVLGVAGDSKERVKAFQREPCGLSGAPRPVRLCHEELSGEGHPRLGAHRQGRAHRGRARRAEGV